MRGVCFFADYRVERRKTSPLTPSVISVVNVALALQIVAVHQEPSPCPFRVGQVVYNGFSEIFHWKQLPAEADAARSADSEPNQ